MTVTASRALAATAEPSAAPPSAAPSSPAPACPTPPSPASSSPASRSRAPPSAASPSPASPSPAAASPAPQRNSLDLADCTFAGPALPAPFVRFELPPVLARHHGLPAGSQAPGWDELRRQLASLGGTAGPLRVHNHVVVPLARCLGYAVPVRQEPVQTREAAEDGGWCLQSPDGTKLRAWSVAIGTALDAPSRSGRAYRFSPMRSAQRVLLAGGERAGLLTNGGELRLLLCEPGRPDSHIAITLAGWHGSRTAPDSFRLLSALAGPAGLAALPDILDAARLHQVRITTDLRLQARTAIEGFLQSVLDARDNATRLAAWDRETLAARLWQEALVLVYRLLFILKMEAADDPARAFGFASTILWRRALSPNQALGGLVRRHVDQGHATGRMLEDGLRLLFRAFSDGLACSELCITPLGGALFGPAATPVLDALAWGEHGVALLLDRLLWTTPPGRPRARVQYGALDVEELGRVYEALLELEPGIAGQEMLRLRHARLEVVAPVRHCRHVGSAPADRIASGNFYLRAGFGRKSTGSYYTPHEFVRFLVRETLAPQIAERSPDGDPAPAAILALKVVDPAMGSGHFLVEACRFLGEALHAACRLCDEQASAAEAAAARTQGEPRTRLLRRAQILRDRLAALPDPDGTLRAYLPRHVCASGGSSVSESRGLAFCRRLVAVHCLYGVDRNALAIELAKLSLWLESYAEGLPLTFLDHRLLPGDSIAGPFAADLATLPVSRTPLTGVVSFGIAERLAEAVARAQAEVRTLQASIGRDAADLVLKQAAKARLDALLEPLRALARAWSGAVMLGTPDADAAWMTLARQVARDGAWPTRLTPEQAAIAQAGAAAFPWDLAFPEVFAPADSGGFDAVLGNPPWDVVQYSTRDFVAAFDIRVLDAPTRQDAAAIERRVLADPCRRGRFDAYRAGFDRQKRLVERLFRHQTVALGKARTAGNLDTFRLFAERKFQLTGESGAIGMVVPSAFHANEGATAIRLLYLDRTNLECCLSFENRRRLFDIDSRFKFALVVARRPGPTQQIRCAFYLESFAQAEEPARCLTYDRAFIRAAGGEHLALPELRGQIDLLVARQMVLPHGTLGAWCAQHGVVFGRDLHMTDDAADFVPLARRGQAIACPRGHLLLHEGKTFHQYTDRWDTAPRYAVAAEALARKPATQAASKRFRLVFRDIARSSDERTLIAAILAPGVVCGHTATTERAPQRRPPAVALVLCGLLNSFPVDWAARQKAAVHLSLFIMQGLPLPMLADSAERLLAHGALRLSCNSPGYAGLWREQLGNIWRETSGARPHWPVLTDPAERWRVRAAMDAVVAHAFGLDRAAYVQVLGGFSHKSFAAAPAFCLDAFDALASDGLAAFCRGHDPYWQVSLSAERGEARQRDR